MLKSVKLQFSVNTNIFYCFFFLSQKLFFMGLRNQICFQILTVEIESYRFKQKKKKKTKIEFLGEMLFLTKNTSFENFSNFSVEAEKLIFPTKWVVLALEQLAKFLIKLKYCLSIF